MRAERASDIRADVGPNLLITSDPRRVDSAQPRINRKRKLLFKVNVNPRYNNGERTSNKAAILLVLKISGRRLPAIRKWLLSYMKRILLASTKICHPH